MRWTVEGAQAMLHLRSVPLNGHWDDFIRVPHQSWARAALQQGCGIEMCELRPHDYKCVSSNVRLMDFLPRRDFNAGVQRYRGNYKCRGFSCRDQFLAMAFAQLTYRESLCDIEICLRALGPIFFPRGVPLLDFQEHDGGRQSASRLADLRRLRAHPDSACPRTLRERPAGRGSRTDGLRPGLDHDRSLPEPLPVGQIPNHQSGGQTAHAFGPPRPHSLFCARFTRNNAGRQRARPTAHRACRVLCDGSSVPRLPPAATVHDVGRLLCNKGPSGTFAARSGAFGPWIARQGYEAITRSCSME